MNWYWKTGKRVLFCLMTGAGFSLLTALARLLGGLISGTRPVINWLMPLTQPPMSVTLAAVMLLALLGAWTGVLIMGAGCAIGAAAGGFAANLPVDYSNGWPTNYPGGYLDGITLELAIGISAILLAIAVQLLANLLRRRKER